MKKNSKKNPILKMNLTSSPMEGDFVKEHIPQMISFKAIMELPKSERDVVLSLINSNGNIRNEIEVMLETKGILVNKY
tara:strand:- start:5960 stop:6193 length:234 start_codon:yes stop_codon:yes gene_type:complete